MRKNFEHIVLKLAIVFCTLFFMVLNGFVATAQSSHMITFCGYPVPLQQDFVQNKMINVIKSQVNVVNLPELRRRANSYMPTIEKYLNAYGLHNDLKYLPIVESGFISNAESGVGARGLWQIMPATARGYGLKIEAGNDERENFDKSTRLACQLIRDNYTTIKRLTGVTNWPLAIAAYNFGAGNIVKAVKSQGSNYFTMNLNKETSLYVYKIIAVKELFEYPEIYNSQFGYNLFSNNAKAPKARKPKDNSSDDEIASEISKEIVKNINSKTKEKKQKEVLVLAHIEGNFKKFKDGDLVNIVLDDDLITEKDGKSFKGYSFGIQGWIIDDRVFFKLGYGHAVTLLDSDLEKGVLLSELKTRKKVNVILKNYVNE